MSRMLTKFAALAVCAAALGAVASPTLAQERFIFEGKALKTAPPAASKMAPFLEEFAAYDEAVVANKGKPPADAASRIKKLRAMAGPFAAEVQAVAVRAKSNSETVTLDKAFMADMKRLGRAESAQEVQAMGGITQVLSNAEKIVDGDINTLSRGVAQNSMGGVLAELFGVSPAEAALRYRICMFAMWAAPGVTSDVAGRLCNRYS